MSITYIYNNESFEIKLKENIYTLDLNNIIYNDLLKKNKINPLIMLNEDKLFISNNIVINNFNISTLNNLSILNISSFKVKDNLCNLPVNLEELYCSNCDLSSLNLVYLRKLKILDCSNNTNLDNLDFLPINLEELYCKNCDKLRLNILYLRKLKILYCQVNNNDDLSYIPNVKTIYIRIKTENNPLPDILSNNIVEAYGMKLPINQIYQHSIMFAPAVIQIYHKLRIVQRYVRKCYWRRIRKVMVIQRWIVPKGYNELSNYPIFIIMNLRKSGYTQEESEKAVRNHQRKLLMEMYKE